MVIAYASKTGNIARFAAQLALPLLRIESGLERLEEPAVLLTYTTGFGQVPPEVELFARANHPFIRGVAASGNRSWGRNFARAADRLTERYGWPVLLKFELAGLESDRRRFMEALKRLDPAVVPI
ncbi:class Ib ribonucleoside-diphosphate reductase assembly flavoprotein NrdI [Meiothermus granaticius]|uniref:Protein NrdI n=1 Tax=Meiothermus granaticius NBRC 107808 TaxID=1227551 RepID=A0A399FAF1_9DEIN|nr:class Ib ribonucleoside-diphosphate reductase assembly flavoprotein NrdI [Meiothermus granaticius]RIH93574.1 Protein NrdI [Meiothermus granaticius NBRC 107808]GEM87212.1 protein NrdI [Meiothermus granaticius NBRC 107808]